MYIEQKNLPRKKRRKLEAAREMLEEENQSEKLEVCPVCFSFFLTFIHIQKVAYILCNSSTLKCFSRLLGKLFGTLNNCSIDLILAQLDVHLLTNTMQQLCSGIGDSDFVKLIKF